MFLGFTVFAFGGSISTHDLVDFETPKTPIKLFEMSR
jgi:hypothetical protein